MLSPCPRDCIYGDWTKWSTCEPFCKGNQSRSRKAKVEAADGGKPCSKEERHSGGSWQWEIALFDRGIMLCFVKSFGFPMDQGGFPRPTKPAKFPGAISTLFYPCFFCAISFYPTFWIPCNIKQDEEEERNCTNDCADCLWEEWSEWTTCTATCGGLLPTSDVTLYRVLFASFFLFLPLSTSFYLLRLLGMCLSKFSGVAVGHLSLVFLPHVSWTNAHASLLGLLFILGVGAAFTWSLVS